jgi:SAM-dependent methyltransferase
VDISDAEIEIARNKAARAGLDARFVGADMLDLPDDLQVGTFDLVFGSAGVLCWVPDLDRWAQTVAAALKPGGRFILCEHHPFYDSLKFTKGKVEIAKDYFGREKPSQEEGLGLLACGVDTTESYYTLLWPLGDVVNAVIRAGMRLQTLKEFPYQDSEYHAHLSEEFRSRLRKLPIEFHLVARKE